MIFNYFPFKIKQTVRKSALNTCGILFQVFIQITALKRTVSESLMSEKKKTLPTSYQATIPYT